MDRYNKIVIDCDPGIDDAFAILLALKHLDVVGITAVGGNTCLDNTSRNARYLVELAGRSDIPVCAGYDKPMFSELKRAEEVHGSRGMGNVVIAEPQKQLEKQHAVDFLIDIFMNHSDVALLTIGPLTNVAQALLKEPELKKHIPEIICMGGSVTAGNQTPAAEFNIYVDPEAAKIVFEAGIPIKMAGLNLCRQSCMNQEDVEMLRRHRNKAADFAAEILEYSINRGNTQLCDALAAAWMIDPRIVTFALPMQVSVETKGEFTRGMTVCDYREYMGVRPAVDLDRKSRESVPAAGKNVLAAKELEQELFKKLLRETFADY